jgi:guanylate kinase
VKSLLYDYNRFFCKVVTHTTRKPRREEVNDTSYHFIPLDRYNELVSQGNYFVEHAQVHNNFYGVSYASWESVSKAGKIPILEIDIQGAKDIRNKAAILGITPKFLFVAPPSMAMLVRVIIILLLTSRAILAYVLMVLVCIHKQEERLTRRGAESAEEIQLRLRNAEIELEEAYRCQLFDHIMVNNVFDQSVNQIFRLARDW